MRASKTPTSTRPAARASRANCQSPAERPGTNRGSPAFGFTQHPGEWRVLAQVAPALAVFTDDAANVGHGLAKHLLPLLCVPFVDALLLAPLPQQPERFVDQRAPEPLRERPVIREASAFGAAVAVPIPSADQLAGAHALGATPSCHE
jgi:hypothetical protein